MIDKLDEQLKGDLTDSQRGTQKIASCKKTRNNFQRTKGWYALVFKRI